MARPRAKLPSCLHVGLGKVSQPGDLGEDLAAGTVQGVWFCTCAYMDRKASLSYKLVSTWTQHACTSMSDACTGAYIQVLLSQ